MGKAVATRIFATFGIILAILTMLGGIVEFNAAVILLEFVRGLFWLIVGASALTIFIGNFRDKKWLWE